jgi:RNA polymerase sigma-70 factor (ECF subfamily)
VPPDDSTRWSLIRKAARGLPPDQEDFAAVYGPAARAYLVARWRGTPLLQEVDDAVQEVLLACLRGGGALARADENRPGGFRAFFYGIVRNVALHAERSARRRKDRPAAVERDLEEVPADDPGLSTAFDRAWAEAIVREAAVRHRELASEGGEQAARRLELLRLRHEEGLPIREIAERQGADPDYLHHQYAKAREDFRKALVEVVSFHHPGASPDAVEAECRKVLEALRS